MKINNTTGRKGTQAMTDMDTYNTVCRSRFESIEKKVDNHHSDLMTAIGDLNKRLFVGNGQRALSERVMLLEERQPTTRAQRIAFGSLAGFGGVGGLGGIAWIIKTIIDALAEHAG